MIEGLIGRKIGMTQIFTDDGQVIPVTIVKAGPCLVVQKKIKENNELMKVQIGFVEDKRYKRVNKPTQGHFAKANVPPTRRLKEFFVDDDTYKVGDTIKVDIFSEKEIVRVIGITKGKGFQGVVKRHGFAGGRDTHGSMFHRRGGSIGSNTYPGRVIKGKKMPGHTGTNKRTIKGLQVVKVDAEHNILLLKGAVPGYNGNTIYVMKDTFKRR